MLCVCSFFIIIDVVAICPEGFMILIFDFISYILFACFGAAGKHNYTQYRDANNVCNWSSKMLYARAVSTHLLAV